MTLDLPPFTLIGATTRTGLLTTPLRDRFGVCHRLEHYDPADLRRIVMRSAGILGVEVEEAGGGSDRRARRAAPRASPTGCCGGSATSPRSAARAWSARRSRARRSTLLEVDGAGLDRHDRQLLAAIAEKFAGGPVGVSTLAAAVGEEADTIEDVFEPYLLQQGLVKRTPRGRVLTERGYEHLGLPAPEGHAQPVLSQPRLEPCLRRLASLARNAFLHLPELREPGAERGANRRVLRASEGLLEMRLRVPLRAARRLHAGPRRRLLHL